MKYVFETENAFCREQDDKTIAEMLKKMYAIEDNLDFLCEEYQRQFPNEVSSTVLNIFRGDTILVDMDSANDEFLISKGNTSLSVCLEVVTKQIAEDNDHDFLSDVSIQELIENKYKVGDGNYSYYTKLSDTGYYFRFM
jgi:hypothetical protein